MPTLERPPYALTQLAPTPRNMSLWGGSRGGQNRMYGDYFGQKLKAPALGESTYIWHFTRDPATGDGVIKVLDVNGNPVQLDAEGLTWAGTLADAIVEHTEFEFPPGTDHAQLRAVPEQMHGSTDPPQLVLTADDSGGSTANLDGEDVNLSINPTSGSLLITDRSTGNTVGQFTTSGFTPKVYQKDSATWAGSEITLTDSTCQYIRVLDLCVVFIKITFGGGGTSGHDILLRTPLGRATTVAFVGGTGKYYDASAGAWFPVIYSGGSQPDDLVGVERSYASGTSNLNLGNVIDVASSDWLWGMFVYKTDGSTAATT